MRPFIVIVTQPDIKICLQGFHAVIDFLPECYLVELLKNGLVEPLTDTICLWMPGLCLGVVNVIYCQIELVIVLLCLATILGSSICKNPQHRHIVFFEER